MLQPDHDNDIGSVIALPDELLSAVFAECSSDSISYPPIFTQICSRWREVAHHTPRLWTTIEISRSLLAQRESTTEYSECLDLLKLWVSRTGDLAIDLSIVSPYVPGVPRERLATVDTMAEKLMIMFPHKWRSIATSTREAHEVLSLIGNLPHPRLESLSLEFRTFSFCRAHSEHLMAEVFHGNFPRLNKLTAGLDSNTSSSCLAYSLPWSTVQDVELYAGRPPTSMYLPPSFICHLLVTGRNMTSLVLSNASWHNSQTVLPKCVLESLVCLTIGGTRDAMKAIVSVVTLPSLRLLVLDQSWSSSTSGAPTVGEDLINLRRRSQCPLAELRLCGMLVPEDSKGIEVHDLIHFLRISDTVSALHVQNCDDFSLRTLIQALVYDPDDEQHNLLPNLTQFTVARYSPEYEERGNGELDQHLIDLLRSRWWDSPSVERDNSNGTLDRRSPKKLEMIEVDSDCVSRPETWNIIYRDD